MIVGLVFVCCKNWQISLFAFIPFPFCIWTFFSFFYPKDVQNHVFKLVLTFASRFLCNLASLLIPFLFWKFIPGFSESVSALWILLSLGEIMLTYLLAIIANFKETRED